MRQLDQLLVEAASALEAAIPHLDGEEEFNARSISSEIRAAFNERVKVWEAFRELSDQRKERAQ